MPIAFLSMEFSLIVYETEAALESCNVSRHLPPEVVPQPWSSRVKVQVRIWVGGLSLAGASRKC